MSVLFVLDGPEVLKVTAEMSAEYGVADRLECRPGDMFRDELPGGCDTVLLSNVLHDWKLPIPSLIGYRSYLNQDTLPGDTCLVFTEPILDAWQIEYRLITVREQRDEIAQLFERCRVAGKPGVALIAEGKA